MLDEIRSRIRLEGDLDESQRKRLLQIARRCPGSSNPYVGSKASARS